MSRTVASAAGHQAAGAVKTLLGGDPTTRLAAGLTHPRPPLPLYHGTSQRCLKQMRRADGTLAPRAGMGMDGIGLYCSSEIDEAGMYAFDRPKWLPVTHRIELGYRASEDDLAPAVVRLTPKPGIKPHVVFTDYKHQPMPPWTSPNRDTDAIVTLNSEGHYGRVCVTEVGLRKFDATAATPEEMEQLHREFTVRITEREAEQARGSPE